MVDLMSLLSDALIGSFQMFMLNDFGKNMFPYRIKTCWKRILIYGVTALVYVRKIPTLVIGSYNDQCVILQAVKDNAKIHTAELKIVDSVCHDMMLDPDWRNIADLIFKFIEKTIDKKSGDNYNDNYVSTQAHQGGE